LQVFAVDAVRQVLGDAGAMQRALGELLSEPKAQVSFDRQAHAAAARAVRLDRRTRMMYDAVSVYINGESFAAGGRDAELMHRLADRRGLRASELRRLSKGARGLVDEWIEAGWLHGVDE
jgi:50S ribosomal protein L16 3-hydroxylase